MLSIFFSTIPGQKTVPGTCDPHVNVNWEAIGVFFSDKGYCFSKLLMFSCPSEGSLSAFAMALDMMPLVS